MTIPEIKLSDEEMCEAVGMFLKRAGISVPVSHVEKNYTGTGAFRVTLEEPTEEQASVGGNDPTPPPQS